MTDVQVAKHASESGHWYNELAELIESVPYADRAARERWNANPKNHNHKDWPKPLDRAPNKGDAVRRGCAWAPGCTTIIKVVTPRQLLDYIIRQAILSAATLPRAKGETDDEWLGRVNADRQEHARQAAEDGTRMHAAVQNAIEGNEYDPAYAPRVDRVIEIIDGLTGSWLIDLKGKEGTQAQLDGLKTYDSHWMQLAATERALMHSGATTGGAWMSEVACVHYGGYGTKADLLRTEGDDWPDGIRRGICYVSRDNPGAATLVEVTETQIGRGWDLFRAQLHLWQKLNDYRPSWAEPF